MVNEVKEHGFYACVAYNVNVFKQFSNTDSIVDYTILCPLHERLKPLLQDIHAKQLALLGFGNKVFGTLEVANVDSLGLSTFVVYARAIKLDVKAPIHIDGVLALQACLINHERKTISVVLHSKVVDQVLRLHT
ncbi:hypothetical protein GOP47_0030073 [Adiantum capillus-veneris]|nr:hypothetical protein GOP47_0030073 [Adiantum capillus-veneris]